MTLYLPVGIPGSGKSTLTRKLIEADVIHPDAVVSPDRYRELLTGSKINQDVNPQAWTITRIMATNRLWHGQDVYLDATNLVVKNFKEYRDVALESGHRVVYIWFGNKVQAQVRNNNRSAAEKVPDGAMRRMIGYWMQAHNWLPKNDGVSVAYNHIDTDLIEKIAGLRDPKDYE